jgi:hypothetical protein
MQNISSYNVPENPCYSCPFAGKKPVQLSPDRLAYYYQNLLSGKSQHICHSQEKTICRGGRDVQIRVFYGRKLIDAPTDEAFEKAIKNAAD